MNDFNIVLEEGMGHIYSDETLPQTTLTIK